MTDAFSIKRGFVICWVLCFCGMAARAEVVINEIMFDPSGSEFTDEYIELYNAGTVAVDLSGWRIGDDDERDALLPVGDRTVLPAGAYALILDAEYASGSQPYHYPDNALILTVDGATLGHSGLHNTIAERILLLSAAGDTVSVGLYRVGNLPGISEERIDPFGGNEIENWTDARWITPGRINSVSVKVFDVALRLAMGAPLSLPWGQAGRLEIWAINVGRESAAHFQIDVQDASGLLENRAIERIAAGDSALVSFNLNANSGEQKDVWGRVRWPADQDTTNQDVRLRVIGGVPSGAVAISEVMAAPETGAGEWVELANLLDHPIPLNGWTLSDAATMGTVETGELAAHGHAVLVERAADWDDGLPVIALSRWPRLNDGGDLLVLKDATGTAVDTVAYPEASRAVALERIDVSKSGRDEKNWLASTSPTGATPGAPNSVAAIETASIQLTAHPNPFDDETVVTYALPTTRAHVNLSVFDRLGRRVRTLLTEAEGGGQRQVVWDGLSDGGQSLKPGIYILMLEAQTAHGALIRTKTSIVLARGL